jgi:hypothetical protein
MPEERAEFLPGIHFEIGHVQESFVCKGEDGCGLPVADSSLHMAWHVRLERRLRGDEK